MTASPENPDDFGHVEHVERVVRNGDIALHVERFARPRAADAAPASAIVLLSEAEAPSTRWPESLIAGLVDRIGSVIIFDTRDVGRSSWLAEPYTMGDLVADVVAVLDDFGIESAHLFGRSMGGQVAQHSAIEHLDRVESLVLLSTTPGQRETLGMPQSWLIDNMAERLLGEWPETLDERTEWIVEQQRWFAGPVFERDEESLHAEAAVEAERFWRGPNGHGVAVMEAPDIVHRLPEITVPATVVHGTADPVLPVEHGRALARHLGDATLYLAEGLGHELPEAFVPTLLDVIDAHLGRCGVSG